MKCKHLCSDVCDIARKLLVGYGIDAAPRPHVSACAFCTNRASPPQQINEVTVSLALTTAQDPTARRGIFLAHKQHLQQTAPSEGGERLEAIEQGHGVGSTLWRLLASLGIQHTTTCSCLTLAEEMNRLGPDGCRRERSRLVASMRRNARVYGWGAVTVAATRAVASGLAWRLNPLDPYGSLLDEAIRRVETASEKPAIDIVLPLGPGSRYGDIELRFALRSIREHAEGLRRIVVLGAIPSWLREADAVVPVRLPEFTKTNKAARIALKFRWAFERLDVTDTVAMWNDDYLMLRQQDIRTIPPIYRGQLGRKPIGGWRRLLQHTSEILSEAGYGTRHFDIHVPIVYERQKFLAINDWWERCAKDRIGLVAKSVYGNIHYADTAVKGRDCKLQGDWQRRIETERVTRRWVISYGDGALAARFADWMAKRYPEPAPWEQAAVVAVDKSRKRKTCC